MSSLRPILFFLAAATCACGGERLPVKSTTIAHRPPDYTPPLAAPSARETLGETLAPTAQDPRERMAFVRSGSIWIMRPDGTDASRLTMRATRGPDTGPALSPRGDLVAFSSRREGATKIHLVALDGSGARTLTDGADGGDTAPAWSPEGDRLVFVRGRPEERRDLYVVGIGPEARPSLLLEGQDDDPGHAGWPAWSPDGKTIAFSSDRGEGRGTGLWLVDSDGKGLRRLTHPPMALRWVRDLRPAWSPDGARIAFASNRHGGAEKDAEDLDLYGVEIAGGALARLTRDPAVADDPVYSPDGERLYFVSTREAVRPFATEIYVMPAEGGEQSRLTKDAIPENAAPSPGRVWNPR